jgi:hypothetical protein
LYKMERQRMWVGGGGVNPLVSSEVLQVMYKIAIFNVQQNNLET